MLHLEKNSPSVFDMIADWISRKASLVLILLMIQIGLVLAMYSLITSMNTPQLSHRSRGTTNTLCGRYEVVFNGKASMKDVQQWSLNFNASIVSGPNNRGAFEIEIPGLTLSETRQAFGSLAADIRSNPLCTSSESTE